MPTVIIVPSPMRPGRQSLRKGYYVREWEGGSWERCGWFRYWFQANVVGMVEGMALLKVGR